MNIAFFGTSDRSVPILEKLRSVFKLSLVVTKANVKVGRKQEEKEVRVKTWTKQNAVPFVEITNLAKDQDKVISELAARNITVGVVADFSFIISQRLLDTPPLGFINIHFSLLPKYRGASPVQFSILNGDKQTGITYYLMDNQMDTGKILHQITYSLNGDEGSASLYTTLFELAATHLPWVITSYASGELKPMEQNSGDANYTYSKTNPKTTTVVKEDAHINWSDKPAAIERQIRAFSGWPVSYTTLGELENNRTITATFSVKDPAKKNMSIKIHKAVLEKGQLRPIEVQVEGKNRISWESFLNGYAVV